MDNTDEIIVYKILIKFSNNEEAFKFVSDGLKFLITLEDNDQLIIFNDIEFNNRTELINIMTVIINKLKTKFCP